MVSLVGANNGYLYTGAIQVDRPAANFTQRAVPAHVAANVQLEAYMIAWYG